MARTLVTGGAGFIGSHLAERLCRDGHDVRVLDNLSTGDTVNLGPISAAIEFLEGDIRDEALVEKAVQDIDWVCHLAAEVSVPQSVANPQFTIDVNVRGTAVVAYAAAAADVQQFLFASSCAVYGETGPNPVAESALPHPLSPYGASKLMAECLLGAQHRSGVLPTLSCRFFNVYGARQRGDSPYSGVVAQFLDRVRAGEPLQIYGDGEQTRDFIEVRDVVGALMSAVTQDPQGWPDTVNLGTGVPSTVQELASAVAGCVSNSPPITFLEERRGDLRHSCADTALAREMLGWAAQVDLVRGIHSLWEAEE